MFESRESNGWVTVWGFLQLLWRKKYIVAAIITIALLGAYFSYLIASPVYRASSILMIDNTGAGQRFYSDGSGGGAQSAEIKERIETDLAILQSFPLAERVVDSLYSNPNRDSLEIFGERKYRTKVEVFFDGLFGKSDSEEPEQIGQEPDRIVAEGVVQGVNVGDVPVADPDTSEQIDPLREEQRGKTRQQPDFFRTKRQFAEVLLSRVNVDNQPGTNIVNISIASPFPDESALLVNALCQIFQGWNLEQAQSLNNFISDQLTRQEEKVKSIEKVLSNYMINENIYELTGNAGEILAQVVAVDTRYNDIQAETNILKRRLEYLAEKLSGEEKALSDRVANALALKLNTFKEKIRKQEKVLQALILETGKDNIAVREKQAEIEQMKIQLNQMTRTQIAGELGYAARTRQFKYDLISEQLQTDLKLAELEYSANELMRLKQQYESDLSKLPDKQLEFARLQRDREVINSTYLFLRQRLEESRMNIASKTGEVVIVGEAFPPDAPVSPNLKKKLLIGLLSGLSMSALLVYVMNVFDDTISDEHFFDDNGFIILARIPFIGSQQRRSLSSSGKPSMDEAQGSSRMLITEELSSAFAESFRDLRTNLGLFHDNSKTKSLLVTGTSVSEGKSTVCANLGLSMSMLGKTVVIVDCDLRRPSQNDFFHTANKQGLSDFLSGDADTIEDQSIQATGYENLSILPAGSTVSNPNELLYSSRMQKLVEELKLQYDLVLLDSPPMLLLSDAAILSQSVDGVLLIGRMRYSSKKHFKELKKLVFLKENLLGVVLIGDTFQKKYGKYGYSNKHMDRYSSSG